MKRTITNLMNLSVFLLLVMFSIQSNAQCSSSFTFHQTANTLTVDFTDASTSSNTISSWAWDFGDGNTSTAQNPSHTYTHDGPYHVCLTIHDDHGCSSTFCHQITVDPVAAAHCQAAFTFHQTANTLTVDFTDASTSSNTITSWAWDFGDGNTSATQNPSHTYVHDGPYNVCLTIHDDHGCSSTFCHQITVDPVAATHCQAAFTFHQIANTLTVDFTDASTSSNTIISWAWDFGDGNTSTAQNPSHTYAHDGPYNVCLTIHDDHGCSSTFCHQITVDPVAAAHCQAAFTFHQTTNTLIVDFTDASTSSNTITSWAWDFGDGSTSTLQNPSHIYSHSGPYHVCLTIYDDHGCSSTFCHHITVHPIIHHALTFIVNYPNPAQSSTTIQYELGTATNVSIEIYNFMGHRVNSILNEIQSEGVHIQPINLDELNSGYYFIRMIVGGETYDQKITVVNK